ncbi:LigB domain-containing protein [Favolaschia claudopus]|uniref:LigB domain-containing protein n=1 Tax=Favolaschia claudopus TaxID=2862362 RepID=A0AAW0DV04_9AGAR
MCGRYSLRLDASEIEQLSGYDASVEQWERRDAFVPRYNIAPHSQAPVVRRQHPNSDTLVMSTMKWGLVPHYSKFEDKSLNTTNARAENLVEGGGMWASIKGPKRCAVVCQGYYEWLSKGKNNKLPHFVKPRDGRLMLMAGLWDSVVLQGETETLWTFSIVTTAANASFSWLHERQPVILHTKAALDAWLDTSSLKWNTALVPLLEPTSCPLECYQVPKEVGKVGTESSTFIEPVANRKDGIQAMFTKQKQAQAASPKKKDSTSTLKRRRSLSVEEVPSPQKKKATTTAAPDSDDEVEIVENPSPSPTKKRKGNKPKDDDRPKASSSKMSSFFSPKS